MGLALGRRPTYANDLNIFEWGHVTTERPERQTRGSATRQRIVAEARRTLVAEGYDAVVLRTIAERIDIKLGNLQYYFRTRDDLLLEVIRDEARSDLEAIRGIAEREQPGIDALRQLVRTLVNKWRSDSGFVFSTLLFLSHHQRPFADAYREVYARFYEVLERAIERAQPGHDRSTYRTRALLLTALIDGAAMQTHTGPRSQYVDAVIDVALRIALDPT